MSGAGFSILASIMYFGMLVSMVHDFWGARDAFIRALSRLGTDPDIPPTPPSAQILPWSALQPTPKPMTPVAKEGLLAHPLAA